MAVLSMKKVNICALKKDRKSILETLQRLGLVEVSDLDENLSDFKKIDTFNMRAVFEKNKVIAQNALEILEKYLPEEKGFLDSLRGQNEISKENYYIFANETEEIMRVANEIVRLAKLIDDEKAEIIRLNAQIDALSDWKFLDVSMDFAGTKKTRTFIGTLPLDISESEAKSLLAEALPDEEMYTLEVLSRSAEQTCIFVLCHVSASDRLWTALRENSFALPTFVSDEVPSLKIEALLRKINDLETRIFNAEKEIKSYKGQRNAIKFMVDYHEMRAQKYEVISKLWHSKNVFMLSGFVPQKICKKIGVRFNLQIRYCD